MTSKVASGCGGPLVDGDHSLQNLIKKIGKGPKLSQSLSFEEAKDACSQILNPKTHPAQIGAFLIALRMKGESIDETAGLAAGLKDKSQILNKNEIDLELAPAHDGKEKSLVLTPYIAMALAKAGVRVLVSQGRDVPTKFGCTSADIFNELGQKTIGKSKNDVLSEIKTQNFSYWDVSDYCPALEALKPLRASLGLRTPLNSVEKLIQPSNAAYLMTGIFHGPYLNTLSQACLQLNIQNALCVQATEASTDLPTRKRVLYRLLKNKQVLEQAEITPTDFGIDSKENPMINDFSAKAQIAHVTESLANKTGLTWQALVYNLSVCLWFLEKVASPVEGKEQAIDLLGKIAIPKNIH